MDLLEFLALVAIAVVLYQIMLKLDGIKKSLDALKDTHRTKVDSQEKAGADGGGP